ncbi:hypothetical protein C6381_13170, partial [Pseudomonas syringae pv. actinidiae]
MTRSVLQNAGGLGYIFTESANGAFKRGMKGWVMAGFCPEGVGAFGGYDGCDGLRSGFETGAYGVPYFLVPTLRVVMHFVTLCVTQLYDSVRFRLDLRHLFAP